MSRVAVIGSGISGSAAAWLLSRRHEVWLYEKESRLGGHTLTATVAAPEGNCPVDVGFIVHNEPNYPLLCRLFRELGIATVPSDMSFSVENRPDGLSWCSRGLNGLFAQRRNLVRPRFYALLSEIRRFNSRARALLAEPGAAAWPLGGWILRERFSDDFRDSYLLPMAGSIWSASPRDMLDFPAASVARFFENHGFLGVTTQVPWRTIPGGCARYLDPLVQPFRERILTGKPVARVERTLRDVTVHAEGAGARTFDEVVFACHGDQVLPLLASPTQAEIEVFGTFRTTSNEAVLHTDPRVMPARRRAWASWNSLRTPEDGGRSVTTYHMNRLQPLETRSDCFVSLNPGALVDGSRALSRFAFRHPRLSQDSILAQGRWPEVSGRNRTHYCGAWWGHGFHEDGLRSAVRVAERMGVKW